jgi:eukaryotic-like serine/threonine-protein kinase
VNSPAQTSKRASFAGFHLDLQTAELSNGAKKMVLPGQAFQVLCALLEHSGELVTRAELKRNLWPENSFGEFDQGLNKAINRLRDALQDDADRPSFIETLPRRGYRWIAPVQWEAGNGNRPHVSTIAPASEGTTESSGEREAIAAPPVAQPRVTETGKRSRSSFLRYGLAALAALVLVIAGIIGGTRLFPPRPPSFHRVTFQRGYIPAARFSPDGQTIIYSAAWNGRDPEIFSTRGDYPGFRALTLDPATLMAVSSGGQVALARNPVASSHVGNFAGTLALAPLAGGPSRDLMENVVCADWTPDGKQMAVVRINDGHYQLEFPVGKVLFQSIGYISNPRVSPDGRFVAFFDHPQPGDDRGTVNLVDSRGMRRTLTELWMGGADGLAWSPRGDEIWFTAAPVGSGNSLYAVNLKGHQRTILRSGIRLVLQDVSKTGQVLLTEEDVRFEIVGLSSDSNREVNLGWLDYSFLTGDLSPDGDSILFSEQGEGAGASYAACIRRLDGSAAVRLGEGMPTSVSADGKWVLSMLPDSTGKVGRALLLPAGPGNSKVLPTSEVVPAWARWFPTGNRMLIAGHAPGKPFRSFIQTPDEITPTPVTPEGVVGFLISPNGTQILAAGPGDGEYSLYPADGGNPSRLQKIEPEYEPFQWSEDGSALYLRHGKAPVEIYRWSIASGQKRLLKSVGPSDGAGLMAIDRILVAHNEKTFVYQYARITSDLFLVEGLP